MAEVKKLDLKNLESTKIKVKAKKHIQSKAAAAEADFLNAEVKQESVALETKVDDSRVDLGFFSNLKKKVDLRHSC